MERKFLEKWLKDAYAMEKSAVEILEKQSRRLGEYPAVQSKIREHLEQTRWQSEQMEMCLSSLGIKPSGLKDAMARISGSLAAMGSSSAEDEVLKDIIADCAFENMEIVSYRSLIAAAQECGEFQVRMTCEQILQQEISMAKWCENNIVALTQEFLNAHAVAH